MFKVAKFDMVEDNVQKTSFHAPCPVEVHDPGAAAEAYSNKVFDPPFPLELAKSRAKLTNNVGNKKFMAEILPERLFIVYCSPLFTWKTFCKIKLTQKILTQKWSKNNT